MKQEEEGWYILSPRGSKSYFPPSGIRIHLENETDDLKNYLNTFVKTLEPDGIIDEPIADEYNKKFPDYDINYLQLLAS